MTITKVRKQTPNELTLGSRWDGLSSVRTAKADGSNVLLQVNGINIWLKPKHAKMLANKLNAFASGRTVIA